MSINPTSTKASKKKVHRELSVEEIVEKVYSAIFAHLLAPGTKLGEDRLASIFGTSRARIREVLARLANDQVVEIIPMRGAFVARPSVEQANDIFEARRLIEPGIIRRLIANRNSETLAALSDHQRKEVDARRKKDEKAIIRLSGEFHLLLAELAGNAVLARSMRELSTITCLIILLYDAPTSSSCRSDEHASIIEAISAGDEKRAVSLTLQHLDGIQKSVNLRGDTLTVDLETVFASL